MPQRGWSAEAKAWTAVRTHVTGSWKAVLLDVIWSKQVSTGAGVYMLVSNPPHTFHADQQLQAPLYIGQAHNLRTRFRQHAGGTGQSRQIRRAFTNIYFWHMEVEEAGMSKVEQALIDAFGPTVNRNNVIAARVTEGIPVNQIGRG